tara:strand:+ start:139 stop:483 length:345 start_codon:yes stop_codon:yes gene_type:complete
MTDLQITLDAQITPGSKQLFCDLVSDAGNWGGSPLFGGNVGGDKASEGHLTHLKKLGLLTTQVDEDDRSCSWVHWTDLGVCYAEDLGLRDLREFGYGEPLTDTMDGADALLNEY